MSRMQVTSSERGLIRLFAVDLPPEETKAFNTRDFDAEDDSTHWPLMAALGATYLDEDFIEYFDVGDLEELGLTGYMVQGLGIAQADVDADASRLNSLRGHVLIVLSSAFDGIAQNLTPNAPLRWIGTYTEEGDDIRFKPLPSKAATEHVPTPVSSTPARANPHLTVLWAVLALPVLALIIGAVIYGVTR